MKKILMLVGAAVAPLFLQAAPAQAQELAVKNMVALCVRGNVSQGISDPSCIGWFEGFSTALRVVGKPQGVDAKVAACVPAGTSVDAQVLAVFQYAQVNPRTLEEPAGPGVYKALAAAYPCSK